MILETKDKQFVFNSKSKHKEIEQSYVKSHLECLCVIAILCHLSNDKHDAHKVCVRNVAGVSAKFICMGEILH